MTGRAFPLFEIAQMILQKPERYTVSFAVKKDAEGKVIEPLFLCALDDTLWLSEDEAVAHVLNKHFATFYQAERTPAEPPKGKYTFVAQCGMSGVILGPPNLNEYQAQLRKIHTERFSRMPFEVYKSRVRIVRDEEVVKKWMEDQSWKTEYTVLNVPEPLKLENREAVEKHFREVHKETIIKQVEAHTLSGVAARNLRSAPLTRLVRQTWEDQRRFPLQIATALSQQFAGHGLQFFKVNKTVTHVSVARPHYLDMEATPVSAGVRRIVEFINANLKSTRRQLVEALAPTPAAPAAAAAAPAVPGVVAEIPTPPVAGSETAAAPDPGATPEARPATPVPPAAAPTGPTPEQTAVIADLHWLIHQGHVIEFATGTLETAKKPLPKPPKPPKPEAKPAEAAAATQSEGQAPSEGMLAGEPAAPGGEIAAEAPIEAPAAPENVPAAPASDEPVAGAAPVAPVPEQLADPAVSQQVLPENKPEPGV